MGRIVHVNPRELLPHPEYSKYHSDRIQLASDYERIKDSIHKNGIREPLIAIEGSNILVCGHKRRMISIELGLDTVPVVYEVIEEEKSIERMVEDNLSRTQSEKDPIIIGEIVVLAKKIYGIAHGGDRVGKRTTMNDMSKMMDMSVSRIKEYERLLSLTISLQNMVRNRIISVRAGSNLSSLPVEAQEWFQESHKEATEIKDTEVTAAIMLWKQKEQEQRTVVNDNAYVDEEEQDDDLNSSLLTQEVRKGEVFDWQLHDVQADAKRQKYQLPEDKKAPVLDLNSEETQYRYSENLMGVKLGQAETTIKRIKLEFETLMFEHSNKFDSPRTYWHSQLDKYVQTVEEFADVVLSYKQDVSELKNSV